MKRRVHGRRGILRFGREKAAGILSYSEGFDAARNGKEPPDARAESISGCEDLPAGDGRGRDL